LSRNDDESTKARGLVKAAEKARVRSTAKLTNEAALIRLKEKQRRHIDVQSADSEDADIERTLKKKARAIERTNDMHRALDGARGKRLLICIKGYPDPDNIGTSLCLQWLARHYDIESTIIHFDTISHHENSDLVKKLDLDLI